MGVVLLASASAQAQSTSRPTTRPATPPASRPIKPTTLPTTPGDHKLKFQTTVDGRTVKMPYLLYLPVGYAASKDPCPVLVFLHGGGETGEDLAGIFAHGPNMNLHRDEYGPFRATFPFIVISPQCPPRGERWDQPVMYKAVIALLQDLETRLPKLDKDRVYLTGLSMGGKGTWFAAHEAPGLFAAIAPLDADMVQPDFVQQLKYTPIWMGGGQEDGGVVDATAKMEEALRKVSHVEVKRTILPHIGHESWEYFYASPQFYEWFLQYRRPTDTRKAALASYTPATEGEAEPPAPHEFGHHAMSFATKIGDRQEELPYTIFLPKTYTPTGQPKPLILFLHEQLTIGIPVNGLCLHGPDAELERKGNELFRNSFQAIVVSPQQMPQFGKWEEPEMSKVLLALLDDVCGKFRVDKSRIYVTGLNDGAVGAWQLGLQSPDRFAALLPVIAQGKFSPPDDAGQKLANLPVWSFMSAADTEGLAKLTEMFKSFRADWTLTPVKENGQDEATNCYRQAQLYEWLLRHHRS